MSRRPLIGITMRLEMPTSRFYLGRDYSECLAAAGAIPLHLGLIPDAELIEEAIAAVDGILLPGSNTDVDPRLYGEDPHPRLGTVIPVKDQTDLLVIEAAERRGLPILGICFGMQILNVSRGESLVQDIESMITDPIKHEQGLPADRLSHAVIIKGGRIISQFDSVQNARDVIMVNSSHHQAVKAVGRDLVSVGWSNDGVVECIEDTRQDRWVLGVQWHPELTTKQDAFSKEIFAAFVDACRPPDQ